MLARYRFSCHWGAVVLLSLMAALPARAAEFRIDDEGAAPPRSLTPYWDVLEDTRQQWTIDDISRPDFDQRFVRSRQTSDSLNFGLRQSAIWLRITFNNASRHGVDRMLEIA